MATSFYTRSIEEQEKLLDFGANVEAFNSCDKILIFPLGCAVFSSLSYCFYDTAGLSLPLIST